MKMEQSVPKRRHGKLRRRGIIQKKENNKAQFEIKNDHLVGYSNIATEDGKSLGVASEYCGVTLPLIELFVFIWTQTGSVDQTGRPRCLRHARHFYMITVKSKK
jgi:hypothetical protein